MYLFMGQITLSTLHCIFLASVCGIDTSGDLLVTNTCYRNPVSLSASKIELVNMDVLQCRRKCALLENCKACQFFTHSVSHYPSCNLYLDNICDYGNVTMYLDSNVIDGSIWEKIPGIEINNATACRSEEKCVIDVPTTTYPSQTADPAEPRPRTCWDYYLHNGTLDVVDYATPRPIWPSGFSNGPNMIVYCRQGYTAILLNYAVLRLGSYTKQNDITVFGSLKELIDITNTTGWNAYVSSINFPVLSALVRISNRTLYYENTGDGATAAVATYSGLDIAPDGALTIEGSIRAVKGSPKNGFMPPLILSSFVSSTCGSFWRIPANSTNICNQTTNMLLLSQTQKVASNNFRFVSLAFK